MNILKNYFYFFKLSLISLILSITLLNLALIFFETKSIDNYNSSCFCCKFYKVKKSLQI